MQTQVRNAWFIAFNKPYIIGAHTLINSIITYHPDTELILLHTEDCQDYIDYIIPYLEEYKMGYKLISRPTFADIKIQRWELIDSFIDEYDAVCMMDADMFVTGRWDELFKIVNGTDLMVLCRDQSERTYGTNYKIKDTSVFDPPIHHVDFCCSVPLIMSKRNRDFLHTWMELNSNPDSIFGDMENMNIALVKSNYVGNIVTFPTEQFTQIRLTFVSPKTRIKHKWLPDGTECANPKDLINGLVITDGHLRVKSVHGKYWDKAWSDTILKYMPKHMHNNFGMNAWDKFPDATDEQMKIPNAMADVLVGRAKESLNITLGLWKKLLDIRIPFEMKFYNHAINSTHIETIQSFATRYWNKLK